MTELTTLDRLKVFRATGAAVTLEPEAVHDLIAMLEEREQVLETIDKIDAIMDGVRADARVLLSLIAVTVIILLGGFVGLWMAA